MSPPNLESPAQSRALGFMDALATELRVPMRVKYISK